MSKVVFCGAAKAARFREGLLQKQPHLKKRRKLLFHHPICLCILTNMCERYVCVCTLINDEQRQNIDFKQFSMLNVIYEENKNLSPLMLSKRNNEENKGIAL